MRLLAGAALLLGGCQCLSNPGAAAPVAPLVPGAPQLPVSLTAAPPMFAVQVPPVQIIPGAVSMGGGVPLPPEPATSVVTASPLLPVQPPEPGTGRPRHRPHEPRTAEPPPPPRTAAPEPGLTAAQIREVVGGAAGRIRRCYEVRLQNEPDLRGRVTVGIVVAADGSVTSADVRDSFDVEIGGCVSNAVSALRFPESPQGGTAVVPFDFAPPGRAEPPAPASANPNQL